MQKKEKKSVFLQSIMSIILAIESSCDDTSAAVLRDDTLMSNVIASQKVHEQYGGVVPELASRAHQQNIIPVVDGAIRQAGIRKDLRTMGRDLEKSVSDDMESVEQELSQTREDIRAAVESEPDEAPAEEEASAGDEASADMNTQEDNAS